MSDVTFPQQLNKHGAAEPAREAGAAPLAEYPGAFQPVTREHARKILDISMRTLENWIREGRFPAPGGIGGRRYWHPDDFFPAVASRLRSSDEQTSVTEVGTDSPKDPAKRGRPPEQHPAASRSVSRSESRCEAIRRRAEAG